MAIAEKAIAWQTLTYRFFLQHFIPADTCDMRIFNVHNSQDLDTEDAVTEE